MVNENKVNSTKGRSGLDPINYKGDVLTQVWLDSRVLATLSTWLEKYDHCPKFMSDVVRKPLEILIDHLVHEGEVKMIDDTATARRMLQGRYNVNLNRGDKGRKNSLHNHVLSDRRGSLSARMERKGMINQVNVPMERKMVSRVEESIVSDRDIERGREEKEKERVEELNNAINSGMVAIEPVEITLKEGMSDEELSEYNRKRDEDRVKVENKPIKVEDFELVKEE